MDHGRFRPIFPFIQNVGKISDYDMFRTFNMGIGMILVVDSTDSQEILNHLQSLGEEAYEIGTVQKGTDEVVFKKE